MPKLRNRATRKRRKKTKNAAGEMVTIRRPVGAKSGRGNGRSRDPLIGGSNQDYAGRDYVTPTCNAIPNSNPAVLRKKRTKKTKLGEVGSTYVLLLDLGDQCGAEALVTKAPGVHRCAQHLTI